MNWGDESSCIAKEAIEELHSAGPFSFFSQSSLLFLDPGMNAWNIVTSRFSLLCLYLMRVHGKFPCLCDYSTFRLHSRPDLDP